MGSRGGKLLVLLAAAAVLAGSAVVFLVPTSAMTPSRHNGLARTPPMGWNPWNHFGRDVDAALVEQTADAMVSSGMKAAGYTFVNLDGGWMGPQRDSDGNLVPDPAKFPDGIAPVAADVHSRGLDFGIYEDAGTHTCNGLPGSLGHESQDAATWASWGVDYLKYDNCNNPTQGEPDGPFIHRYAAMADALLATGRPIVFSVCEWGLRDPWLWAAGAGGNLWRTTSDIRDTYTAMLAAFHTNVRLWRYASPGAWNDPDMLEVGNGGMTTVEDRSQFSLWAEMAAPLIAGTDLRSMSTATRSILTNRDVIAVDQDPLGRQGRPVSDAGGHWVLTKPMANGDRAVVLFNETDSRARISTTAFAAGAGPGSSFELRDLWRHTTTTTTGEISASVPPHGVVMYRLSRRCPQGACRGAGSRGSPSTAASPDADLRGRVARPPV